METIREEKTDMGNGDFLIRKGVYKIKEGYKWILYCKSGECKKLTTALRRARFAEISPSDAEEMIVKNKELLNLKLEIEQKKFEVKLLIEQIENLKNNFDALVFAAAIKTQMSVKVENNNVLHENEKRNLELD